MCVPIFIGGHVVTFAVLFAALFGLLAGLLVATLSGRLRGRAVAPRGEHSVAGPRAFTQRVVEAHESERRRIARELHDEIGQYLTGLGLLLEAVGGQGKAGVRALGEARRLLQELMLKVRELSLDLRPAMLDDLGLVPALVWYCETYTRRTGVEVAFTHEHVEGRRFSPALETAVYRIVQEALTNVARHASVRSARLRLAVAGGGLLAEVEDRGKGFDASATRGALSAGISGMRERADAIGGSLQIESHPGRGTRVAVLFPLD